MRKAAIGLAFVLAGCATGSQKSDIAAVEVGLAAAENAALVYVSLPRCPQTLGPCSMPETVAQIKGADAAAYATVKAAEQTAASGGTVDVTASVAAVAALQKIIPLVKTN